MTIASRELQPGQGRPRGLFGPGLMPFRKVRGALALHLAILAAGLCPARAAVLLEEFSSNPLANGWSVAGEASLFHWNPATGRLEVTWDSSRTNSFFFCRLGTELNRLDEFSLEFDLRLFDILGGARAGKPGPFEIAIGFLNAANTTNPAFVRGTVGKFPNLCEFDYFPQGSNPPPVGIIQPTISPMISPSNSAAVATSFSFPRELTPNDWFHVRLVYTGSNQTLTAQTTCNGQPFDLATAVFTGAGSGFRVDAVSITSYSDAGDRYGSVLAHGEIDNVSVQFPAPPRPLLTGGWSKQHWRVRCAGRTNWNYTLQRSADLRDWAQVAPTQPGVEATLELVETNQPAGPVAFYRVHLGKP